MIFTTVVCLDDLTRTDFWPAKEFIYDLARVPIFHAAGIDIAKSPRRGQRNNLLPGFEADRFLELAGCPGQRWQQLHHALPEAAQAYLAAHIPEGALVIGYELTPALMAVLDRTGCATLDIRLSPLRFGADLYLALRSNVPALREALRAHAVTSQEVIADACLMAAQVRYRRRYDDHAPRLDDTLVYIGQTEKDASLVDDTGAFARASQYASTLRELATTRRLVYRGHPLGGDHGQRERELLRQITGQPVPACEIDTYELLAMDDDTAFVGLSSGVLQEARWFGKQSLSLMPPICEPDFGDDATGNGYLHVHSHVFLGEPMWAAVLDVPVRDGAVRFAAQPNRLRELHNTWWGYATQSLRHSQYHEEMFRLHGGSRANDDGAARLQSDLGIAQQRIDTLRLEIEGLKEALRVVLRQTAQRPPAAAPFVTLTHPVEAAHAA